ncbi:VOC family protein [Arthrobacter wenxiniae]|jgi:catechol 2,3-dioxygenase-like lactoylglutathione lyase family enzyme|uniref:VOC family protein n=1 Tax=Arthrobacter wenxiniae TaxID=2713570 RepID=A0A7Y7M0K2_9MICC|nr:VOC family protein [Arthrobacter wenxiniae]NVM95816.1 VOC family protein [Arthrobacter wenxiniae]
MLEDSKAFGGFSVDNADTARSFYAETLGLDVSYDKGILTLNLAGGGRVIAYAKGEAHQPASFTVLNFPVPDIEAVVDALAGAGVAFEHYEGTPMETDAKGIFRGGGPLIAWFKDPAGNVFSVLQD